MLTVSDLSRQFGGTYLFNNISFSVRPNDKIGLIGRNGAGKSTLLKVITGIMSANGTITTSKNYKIGYLPQELVATSNKTIFEETAGALVEIKALEQKRKEISELLSTRTDYTSKEYLQLVEFLSDTEERYRLIGGHSSEADIEQILIGLGFTRDDFYRHVSEFSGGWQMRIEIAKILLSRPDCILLDEPTNHLDIESIQWFEQFLKNYNGALIIVSHDKFFLDYITNRTIEISLGHIYDMNLPYSKFIETRAAQREQQLAEYKNQQKQISETERYIERFRYKATLATRVQSRIKALDKIERIEIEEEDTSKLNIVLPEPDRSPKLILEAKSLSKSYGSLSVLNNIDFAIERGDKIAFVGKNGEGKTTLAKILAKELDYDFGVLKYGPNITIGYYAQHQANTLDGELTVLDTIDRVAVGDIRPKIRTLLGAFLFSGDSVNKKVKVLSGGEKARLALCKMLLQPSHLLIFDEPTNHLDIKAKEVLKNALLNYNGAMIVVSHDRDFLQDLTNKTIEFKNKHIKEYLGDINYYLEKNKITLLQELERKEIIENKEKNTGKTQNQIDREAQKEKQRNITRTKREIEKIENEIENIENKISEIELLFSQPDYFSNPSNNSALKQKEYNDLKSSLEEKMTKWEELSESLNKLSI